MPSHSHKPHHNTKLNYLVERVRGQLQQDDGSSYQLTGYLVELIGDLRHRRRSLLRLDRLGSNGNTTPRVIGFDTWADQNSNYRSIPHAHTYANHKQAQKRAPSPATYRI